jgi:cytochrome P450 family 6
MLSGSTVAVKETMARFSTDVIASCAFGINANSMKDPDSEFWRYTKALGDELSVRKGLAGLLATFAPYLNTIFRLKYVADETGNYIRQIVWDTVHYR